MELSSLSTVACRLYAFLDTPRSLACYILARNEEWGQLAALRVDPRNYLEGPWGARDFMRDSQATDFLRKSPLIGSPKGRKEAAEKTFLACEEQCLQTNQLLDLLRYPSASESVAETAFRNILFRARNIARRILGPIPDAIEPAFGPGTSFELKGAPFSTVLDKLTTTPVVTAGCSSLFEHYYWPSHWGRESLRLNRPLPGSVRGNRFTTVPKDSTKDRGICVEPGGNLWVQLGIGRHLKRRLELVGLKVGRSPPLDPLQQVHAALHGRREDGQVLHRRLARLGSLGGDWATIDLSNASDTVAYELVRWVIPDDWFQLLCSARSPMTLFRGKWHSLEKFSSMGNGFTFELETLVFAAILAAALGLKVGHDLFVYGDDILLPEAKGRDAMAVLRMSGFSPNMEKSFTSGPFRESCGGDYFSGFPVRSYFASGKFESPLEWIALHNELYGRFGPKAYRILEKAVQNIPTRLRLFGPSRLGHIVLHGRRNQERRIIHPEHAYVCVHAVRTQPSRLPLDRWGSFHLTAALVGVPSSGLTPRGRIDGWSKHLVSVS